MREPVKCLSFAAMLALGVPLSLAPSFLLPAKAGVFDADEDIYADSRRLSRDLSDGSRTQRVAGLFGPSDEEMAAEEAARQREDAQDANIRSLTQRIQDLENTITRLTGQNERLSHQVDQLRVALDRAQKDFDYRICTMTAQQLGTSEDSNGLNCGAAGQSGGSQNYGSTAQQQAGDTTRQLAPPPGSLGTLSVNDLHGGHQSSPATGVPRQIASIDTTGEYNSAMQLLARARYDEARSAFRAFADNHPGDALTPQAVYWVGDIAYVQKDYPAAARAFAEQIKKYPQSDRAPDSMLKLGQSLIAMGQKQEGCTTLGAIKAKYPQASQAILDAAKQNRKVAACR